MKNNFKKFAVAIAAIMTIGSVTLVSCDKEDTMVNQNSNISTKNATNEDLSDSTIVYEYNISGMEHYCNGVYNGNVSDMDTNNIVSIVYNDRIYYFDNDSLLYLFCIENGMSDFYKRSKNLDLIYAKAVELGIQDKDFEDTSDVPRVMKEYWYSVFGTEFGTFPEGNTGAKLTWALTAYDGMTYTGTSKTCVGPTYWSLGKFNNKTTSFKVYNTGVGGIWWCHKKWYGKPRAGYFLVGLPLGMVGWPYVGANNDNKFRSYCTTIH